mmetsp:Transcript_31661/g.89195  ORF Transcript_31661/g.89195 Transcript_31661/m.89195 type:complete len:211 (+) Transcript_31661:556-1188(+)
MPRSFSSCSGPTGCWSAAAPRRCSRSPSETWRSRLPRGTKARSCVDTTSTSHRLAPASQSSSTARTPLRRGRSARPFSCTTSPGRKGPSSSPPPSARVSLVTSTDSPPAAPGPPSSAARCASIALKPCRFLCLPPPCGAAREESTARSCGTASMMSPSHLAIPSSVPSPTSWPPPWRCFSMTTPRAPSSWADSAISTMACATASGITGSA